MIKKLRQLCYDIHEIKTLLQLILPRLVEIKEKLDRLENKDFDRE